MFTKLQNWKVQNVIVYKKIEFLYQLLFSVALPEWEFLVIVCFENGNLYYPSTDPPN